MRRQYSFSVELTVILADPTHVDEEAVRALGRRLADFVVAEVDQFPWAVDISMSQAVDRVEQ